MKKTKIIATLGPATFAREKIKDLLISGINVVRINMSHEISDSLLQDVIKWVRNEARDLSISVAILFDICGPKIRVGRLHEASIDVKEGNTYTLGYTDCDISINMPLSFASLYLDGNVKVDDGNISFQIKHLDDQKLTLVAENSGKILQGKGINFPGTKLNLPSVTEKDKSDLEKAVKFEADWIAMSFVRSASDFTLISQTLQNLNATIPIIAKIEKPEAIEELDQIINTFDGILVARGDLGVEMSIEQLPILQKKIVNKCLQNNKPVIIATQMMDSMIHNPKPSRAEVNDIANAIYDGADAVMLSGETAIGNYPIESVQYMSKIAKSVEKDFDIQNFNRYIRKNAGAIQDHRGGICHAAVTLSDDLSIDTIVLMTESGKMAIKMAQYRPKAQIIALCSQQKIASYLALIWGVTAVKIDSIITIDDMLTYSTKLIKKRGYVEAGDAFIITAGVPVGVTGKTNMLKIHQA